MINFNEPIYTENTIEYITDCLKSKKVCGDGKYTKLCHNYIKNFFNAKEILLTHSCSAALEMSAILSEIKNNDEIIMPSYTFVSTANAFVLQGGVPVFIDIRDDTLNIDEQIIENAITEKTKAIVCVHYAGVGCEMDEIMKIAKKYKLFVIEDAAQAFNSYYKQKHLGTFGDIGCFSFHETKNIMSGEGGCAVVNNETLFERAEIIREKGTNRSKFFRGQIDKYTWVDKGSSYLPSDIIAAYLYSILEIHDMVNTKRLFLWKKYYDSLKTYEKKGIIKLPIIPKYCTNNAHMFYLRFNDLKTRTAFINYLKQYDIYAPFHYIPLHSSPAGKKYGKTYGTLSNTNKIADTLVRLPLFYDLDPKEQDKVIEETCTFMESIQ